MSYPPPGGPPPSPEPYYGPPPPGQPYTPQHWHEEQQRHRQLMREHPHAVPQTYPLILRIRDFAWWKPLVGFVMAVCFFFLVQVLLFPLLLVGALLDRGPGSLETRINAQLEVVTPWSMLYINLGLAALVLVAWLVVRVVHGLPFRWLASVTPGIRWRFFVACLGLSVVALGASLLVGAFLPGDANNTGGASASFPKGQLLATAVVILLTTPLQALGEEYGFRGYLMQTFGSFADWLAESFGASRQTAERVAQGVALVMTSVLFALAHGVQNFPLFFDRFAFGMIAGLLVILVGGLEAGIALHVLNNLLAFGFAVAFDQLDSTLTISEASWWQLVLTVVQNGVYLVLVLLVARRMGLRATTEPAPAG